MAVATGIVKCLEFLTRRETKNRGSQAGRSLGPSDPSSASAPKLRRQGPFSPEPAPPMLLEALRDGPV